MHGALHTMMKQPGHSKHRGGFTLIEVLIATVILTTAVLGLANVSVTTGELRNTGVQKAAALHSVERELAAVAATPFANIQATHDGRGFSVTLPGEANAALHALKTDADGLPGVIHVTAPTGDPAHLLQIRVVIDWQGRSGPQHFERTVRLSSIGASS
jgi:prepilin-type N-terminal cleavage/methylation domain-containing protein